MYPNTLRSHALRQRSSSISASRAAGIPPRVIHENIHLCAALGELRDAVCLAQVERVAFDTYFALVENVRACGFQVGRGASCHVEMAAFPRETLRDCEADASRRAGHERGRSLKTQIHVSSCIVWPEVATAFMFSQ
jgi:hypothetical protein